jgi:hypothetical protein
MPSVEDTLTVAFTTTRGFRSAKRTRRQRVVTNLIAFVEDDLRRFCNAGAPLL